MSSSVKWHNVIYVSWLKNYNSASEVDLENSGMVLALPGVMLHTSGIAIHLTKRRTPADRLARVLCLEAQLN